MSARRIVAIALLVVAAGCTGLGPAGGDGTAAPTTAPTTGPTTVPTTTPTTAPTTDSTSGETTEPHTAYGTSHVGTHLVVRAGAEAENVTVTVAPDRDGATYDVPAGDEIDLSREIHDRGHDARVVVERGSEVVFRESVLAYEYYEVVVRENDIQVEQAVV